MTATSPSTGVGPSIEGGSRVGSRTSKAWQGVNVGVLLAKHVPVWGITALPIVGAGIAPLTVGLYQLFTTRHDRQEK